jgi:adenosylmethionine-8-amino-7-oxononanoate aminotransferase
MSQPASPVEIAAGVLPKISHGRGAYLWDTAGRRYIDGSGGPAVYCLGHGNAEVNAAIADQLAKVAHGYRYLFTAEPLEQLTGLIGERCGGTLRHMVFLSGGSEAVESCLKLALQYHYARGEPGRTRFVARERSYHGNTLMGTALSGFADRRRPFEGGLPFVGRVGAANAYRPPAGVPADDLAAVLAAELEREIVRLGPETIAGFVFEPVVGAAGGVVPAPQGYARAVAEVCRRHGVLLIADEVMCGSGRTGTWRALEFDRVEPDLMAVAKSLSGGYLPLGAAIYSSAIADVLNRHAGGPLTGHTYTGHTACLAAGLAVQRIVVRDRLLRRVAETGARWQAHLRDRFERFDEIGDIRGRGYFIGLELVRDRATKVPFEASLGLHGRIRKAALDRGLICYPGGGHVDGKGDTVILAPPFNASDGELEEIAEKLEASIEAALTEIAADRSTR